MAAISAEVKDHVNRIKMGFVATVTPDNKPSLSPKGSVIVWDEGHLAFANIRSPNTVANLRANPAIEINVVDPLLRKGYRFAGAAAVLDSGEEFETMASHFKKTGIKSEISSVVKITVDEIRDITSPLYDLGMSEEEMKSKWKKIYSES
ncbi:flavin-nucleotide-binding protein [Cenarchaeum symbiosum A]|uniref:Flavin-nucleotide-binding protein n=1 Tax=Cenarchaeum symbiosum (strain A) TaxID=414004 RepID=A0RWS0_CENSY|nr:flavin-nucleotide-binding protein [Cenarchaeum symbiosum A]